MIEKRLLVPQRLRTPPPEGFSWVDRRFVREAAGGLSGEAILLYFFLSAVSDKDGLSCWGNVKTGGRLKLRTDDVIRAREELVLRDLVAYVAPLSQILSMPRTLGGSA